MQENVTQRKSELKLLKASSVAALTRRQAILDASDLVLDPVLMEDIRVRRCRAGLSFLSCSS